MVRTRLGVALVLFAVLAASGCTAARRRAPVGGGPLPAGTSTRALTSGGRARTYRVYRPATTGPRAALVVFLHGGFGSGEQAEQAYGWDRAADAGHFLVAYPDGIDRAWNVDGGGCCGRPAKDGIDDVAFVSAVVSAIGAATPVDRRRVFATGISNGGILAYTLACRTRLFAAIAPDSATQLSACAHPAPLSVLAIHGTADRRVPYAGGAGSGAAHIDGPSVPGVAAFWRRADGCAAPTTTRRDAVTTTSAACPDGRRVELVTVAGAGHQWPGGPSSPILERAGLLDPPSRALDATAVVSRFFGV